MVSDKADVMHRNVSSLKQGLIDTTSAAVARGVFGSPTLFLGDEMFFGKDSLPELEYQLKGAA